MQKIRVVAMVCGTSALALGAGHFMQSADANEPGSVVRAPQTPVPDAVQQTASKGPIEVTSVEMTSAGPTAPEEALALAKMPSTPDGTVQLAALSDTPAVITDALPTEVAAPTLACDYTLTADTAPGAMVALFLGAPCARDQRFTLHHNGLMFTQVTDGDGHASMMVPALAKSAVFIAAFPNGDGAVANTVVEGLDDYQRVAVQWQGNSGVQLHAFEFGAEMGSEGHVWAAARRDVAAAAEGGRGFMTVLGDATQPEALIAEIYSFPSRTSEHNGAVALQVEAEVTQANCARDIEAQALQMQPGGALNVQELTLAIPECEAVGDFLVLKNLLNDITIARN